MDIKQNFTFFERILYFNVTYWGLEMALRILVGTECRVCGGGVFRSFCECAQEELVQWKAKEKEAPPRKLRSMTKRFKIHQEEMI